MNYINELQQTNTEIKVSDMIVFRYLTTICYIDPCIVTMYGKYSYWPLILVLDYQDVYFKKMHLTGSRFTNNETIFYR